MVVLWLEKIFRAKFGPSLDLSPNSFSQYRRVMRDARDGRVGAREARALAHSEKLNGINKTNDHCRG